MLCVGLRLRHDSDKESVRAKNELHDLSNNLFYQHQQNETTEVAKVPHVDQGAISGWELRQFMKRAVSEGQTVRQGKIIKPRGKQNNSRLYLRSLRPKTSSQRSPPSYLQPIYASTAFRLPHQNPQEVFRHRSNKIPSRLETMRNQNTYNSTSVVSTHKTVLPMARVMTTCYSPQTFKPNRQMVRSTNPKPSLYNYTTYKESTAKPLALRPMQQTWKKQRYRIHKQYQSYLQQINQLIGQQRILLDEDSYATHKPCP